MFSNNFKRIQIILFFTLFLYAHKASAASLWIESNTSNIKIGDTVLVTVYVNAGDEAINNVESEFTASNFEIQSINNAGSILNMWVEQPSFTAKTASLNGGVLNPGYSGSAGKVATMSLKAIKEGVGTLSFGSASVRANDGLGTDVLKTKKNLTINISSNTVPQIIPVAPTTPVETIQKSSTENTQTSLKAPIIYASATPDQEAWYNVDNTTFTWDIPSNTIALKTLFGSSPNSEPSVLYDSVIKTKTIRDISDGVWYFHLKYQTTQGWSKTAHKKIKIDTTAPRSVKVTYKTLDSGLLQLDIFADDVTSYITKFTIASPGKEKIDVTEIDKEGRAKIILPPSYSGLTQINVEAFDSAGNFIAENFTIDFPVIELPQIITYPEAIKKGEDLIIKGISKYKDTEIELSALSQKGEVKKYKTITQSDGSFEFTLKSVKDTGILSVWASVFIGEDSYEIQSEKINISVDKTGYKESLSKMTEILSVLVPALGLLVLLIILLYFIFRKVIVRDEDWMRKNKIKKIEKEALDLIDSLKSSVLEDIHLFKADRSINDMREAETVLLKNLLQDFKVIERVMSNKLKRNKVSKKNDEEEV